VLLLTHYHSKSAVAISRFSQNVILRDIWVPAPKDKAEREILSELLRVALEREIRVTIYAENEALTVFDTGILRISERVCRSRSTEPAFSLSLAYGTKQLCYHTASLAEYLSVAQLAHECTATDLILGAHGPVPKTITEILAPTAQSVLLGSGAHLAFYHFAVQDAYVIAPNTYFYQME
jgi:hypothetical protein